MTTTLRIEDYTHAPMARFILTTGEFGRCEGQDTYHEVAAVPVSARQPEAEARGMAALFALAPRMAETLRSIEAGLAVEIGGFFSACEERHLPEGRECSYCRTSRMLAEARAILRKLDGGA